MAVLAICTQCGHRASVAEALVGKTVRCRRCGGGAEVGAQRAPGLGGIYEAAAEESQPPPGIL
jgi:hypothetical protein